VKIWTVLRDPPAAGAWNMAVDEALLEEVRLLGPTLRLYMWSPATLSLGYFQAWEDRRLHPPSLSCPVVRRPTGGGAILHDAELTYALVLPAEDAWAKARERLYFAVHGAIASALRRWGVEAAVYHPACPPSVYSGSDPQRRVEDQEERPERKPSIESGFTSAEIGCTASGRNPRDLPFMCFGRRSCGDLLVGSVKVAGSAQRRTKTGILQHGSILLARSPFAPEFPGLAELIGLQISPDELADTLIEALADELGVKMQAGSLPSSALSRAQELLAAKYAHPHWTQRSALSERRTA